MATQLKPNVDCSAEEWQARLDLAACYRIFDLMGWSESIYNHISLKVPGEEDTFLINPFGLLYDEVTASNLVKVDVEGNNVGPSQYMVNKAGFTQHAYFHKTLGERAHAICHVHTTATMAVCSHEDGLMPTNFYACNFDGQDHSRYVCEDVGAPARMRNSGRDRWHGQAQYCAARGGRYSPTRYFSDAIARRRRHFRL